MNPDHSKKIPLSTPACLFTNRRISISLRLFRRGIKVEKMAIKINVKIVGRSGVGALTQGMRRGGRPSSLYIVSRPPSCVGGKTASQGAFEGVRKKLSFQSNAGICKARALPCPGFAIPGEKSSRGCTQAPQGFANISNALDQTTSTMNPDVRVSRGEPHLSVAVWGLPLRQLDLSYPSASYPCPSVSICVHLWTYLLPGPGGVNGLLEHSAQSWPCCA